MSQFETVLIAAVTSAGVAFAIEWAAKPRLEARKDRILEQSKAKREIERQLGIIVSLAGSLNADVSSLDSSERRKTLDYLEKRRTEVITASKAVESALTVVALKTDPRIRSILSFVIGMTQGIALSSKLRAQAGKELAVVGSLALELYHASWWQFRKRRKLLAAAELLKGAPDAVAHAAGPAQPRQDALNDPSRIN